MWWLALIAFVVGSSAGHSAGQEEEQRRRSQEEERRQEISTAVEAALRNYIAQHPTAPVNFQPALTDGRQKYRVPAQDEVIDVTPTVPSRERRSSGRDFVRKREVWIARLKACAVICDARRDSVGSDALLELAERIEELCSSTEDYLLEEYIKVAKLLMVELDQKHHAANGKKDEDSWM
jgi:hypothetical protein